MKGWVHRMEYTKRLVLKCWHDSRIAHTYRVSCVACFMGTVYKGNMKHISYTIIRIILYCNNIGKFVCLVANSPTRDTRTNHTIILTCLSLSLQLSLDAFDIPCYCCFLIFLSDIVYSINIQWQQIEGEMETCFAIAVHFPMGAYIIKNKL